MLHLLKLCPVGANIGCDWPIPGTPFLVSSLAVADACVCRVGKDDISVWAMGILFLSAVHDFCVWYRYRYTFN
jgi:hypothetical protein